MIYLAPLKTWVVDILEEREKNPNKANTKMPFVIMTSGAKVIKSTGSIKTKQEAIDRAKEIISNNTGVEYKGCIISNQINPSLNYSLQQTLVGFDFTGKPIYAVGEVGRKISMPIIESLDINTDGTNNTLLTAMVNVRCFSLKQLEMFELFFCKAGMHILIEYGDNSSPSTLNLKKVMIQKSDYDTFVGTFKEFTSPTANQFGKYLEACQTSNGSYARVAGKLINYSYSIDQDGTYSVQLEIAQSNEYNLALPKAFITKYKAFDSPSPNDKASQLEQWTNKLVNDLPGLNKSIIKKLKETEWKHHFFNWGKINEDELDKTASTEPYLSLKFILEILSNNTANQGNNSDFILFKDDYFKIKDSTEKIIPITVHNNMISVDNDIIFPNENLPQFTFDEKTGVIKRTKSGVVDGSIGVGNNKLSLIPNKEISFTDPLNNNIILKIPDIKNKEGQPITDLKIGNALNIFVSYKVVGEAWERNTKTIDFVVDILDRINKTSFGLFKLRIGSLYEGAKQTVIDTKLYSLNTEQPDTRKEYRFKPTTINSNVRDFKFNFELTDQVAAATIFNSSKFLASRKAIKEGKSENKDSINQFAELYQSIDYSAFSTADGYFSLNEIEYQQLIKTPVDINTNEEDDKNINETVKAEKEAKRKSYDNFQTKFKFKKGDIRTLIYEDYSFINTELGLNTEDVRSRFELVTPIKVNLTIDGISGITCGETFRVDGIPEQYNKLGQFQITNTKNVINTDQGWTTEIEGEFRYGV
jgi:hypothetical protein